MINLKKSVQTPEQVSRSRPDPPGGGAGTEGGRDPMHGNPRRHVLPTSARASPWRDPGRGSGIALGGRGGSPTPARRTGDRPRRRAHTPVGVSGVAAFHRGRGQGHPPVAGKPRGSFLWEVSWSGKDEKGGDPMIMRAHSPFSVASTQSGPAKLYI